MRSQAIGTFSGTTLVRGEAEGSAFVLTEPLSFWGGLDSSTGRIIDRWHPQQGSCISGVVLVMRAGRGSSSGSSVLAEAIRLRTGPAGIVVLNADAIVTVGSMVASELYDLHCPVVLARDSDWSEISAAREIKIRAAADAAILQLRR